MTFSTDTLLLTRLIEPYIRIHSAANKIQQWYRRRKIEQILMYYYEHTNI